MGLMIFWKPFKKIDFCFVKIISNDLIREICSLILAPPYRKFVRTLDKRMTNCSWPLFLNEPLLLKLSSLPLVSSRRSSNSRCIHTLPKYGPPI